MLAVAINHGWSNTKAIEDRALFWYCCGLLLSLQLRSLPSLLLLVWVAPAANDDAADARTVDDA
jgi:hypothetical protein